MSDELSMTSYVFCCPECGASDVFPGGLPGGPALCVHPSSGYTFTPISDHEQKWRAKRAALVAQHDDGALSTLEDAVLGNADVKCSAYCYGGTAQVNVYEMLADLAEEGWRLAQALRFALSGGPR